MSRTPPPRDPAQDEHTRKGDEKARRHDPHGVAPADESASGEPKAWPSSDRHDTETAAHEQKHRD